MSDDNPQAPRPKESGRAIVVQGTGNEARSLLNQAISDLTAEQRKALSAEAAREALRLEVKAQEQLNDYRHGAQAASDHVDTFARLDKQSGPLNRQSVISEIKTGAGHMRIESKTGATCFVATAAYGDADHPDVEWLRQFRDEVLARSVAGRAFVWTYWRVGPILAIPVGRSPLLRIVCRGAIGRFVRALKAIHP